MQVFQQSRSTRALIMATTAFAVNFSVWTLFSVIGIDLKEQLSLSATEFGMLLSSPILTGALLRLPVGILSERFSSKNLFVMQMLLLVIPLFLLPTINSYVGYLLMGLVVGISGVSFTLGIRYVTDWFESKEQGMAMGVFGAGNAGAALSMPKCGVLAFIIILFLVAFWHLFYGFHSTMFRPTLCRLIKPWRSPYYS